MNSKKFYTLSIDGKGYLHSYKNGKFSFRKREAKLFSKKKEAMSLADKYAMDRGIENMLWALNIVTVTLKEWSPDHIDGVFPDTVKM